MAVNPQKPATVAPITQPVASAVSVAAAVKPKIQPAVPAAIPKVTPKKEVPVKEPVVAKAAPVAPVAPVPAAATPEAPKAEEVKPEEAVKEAEKPTETAEKVEDKTEEKVEEKPVEKPAAPPKPIAWANLFKKDTPKIVAAQPQNGVKAQSNGAYGTLEEALRSFSIIPGEQLVVPFLLPRGLVNTGNMCFMNAVSTRVFMSR